jgi:hypothetical protein
MEHYPNDIVASILTTTIDSSQVDSCPVVFRQALISLATRHRPLREIIASLLTSPLDRLTRFLLHRDYLLSPSLRDSEVDT